MAKHRRHHRIGEIGATDTKTFELYVNSSLFRENDDLPQQICITCLQTLDAIEEFRVKCHEIQEALTVFYKTIQEEKYEYNDDSMTDNYIIYEQEESSPYNAYENEPESKESNFHEDIVESIDEENFRELITYKRDSDLSSVDFESDIEDSRWNCEYFVGTMQNKRNESSENRNEICKFCHKKFQRVLLHVDRCPQRNVEFCKYCDKQFDTTEELNGHLEEVHTDGLFGCPNCYLKFKTRASRKAHMQKYQNIGRHPCSICDVVYMSRKRLLQHCLAIHTANISQECEICHQIYANRTRYKYHMLSHTREKKYQCSYCGKGFMQPHHKKNHELIHTNELPNYLCDTCGKSFKYDLELKKHLLLKHGIRNRPKHDQLYADDHNPDDDIDLDCTCCGKTFATAFSLATHKRSQKATAICAQRPKIHQSPRIPRAVTCPYCPKTYNSSLYLQLHIFTKHHNAQSNSEPTIEHPFKCSICSKGFPGAYGLVKHLKMHEGVRPYECTECRVSFKRREHLKSHTSHVHTKEKRFGCQVCDKKFVMKCDLNSHMLSHSTEKPHKCSQCSSAFKLKSALRKHEIYHTDSRPYVCLACNAKFRGSLELQVHTMSKHSADQIKVVENLIMKNIQKDALQNEEETAVVNIIQ